MNELSKLSPPNGSVTRKKRVGRGAGSGLGKTAGRGQKGQKARSGGSPNRGFEGGQMPLQRRLPKRGFSNWMHQHELRTIQVGALQRFPDGATVDLEALRREGLVKGHDTSVKIVGGGTLTHNLIVRAARIAKKGQQPERTKPERRAERVVVSSAAADAISAAGGSVEVE